MPCIGDQLSTKADDMSLMFKQIKIPFSSYMKVLHVLLIYRHCFPLIYLQREILTILILGGMNVVVKEGLVV